MKITDAGSTLVISEVTEEEKQGILSSIKQAPKKRTNTLTRKEVAALLRVHPGTIKRYDKAGTLNPIRINARTIRYSESEVFELLGMKGAA